MEGADLFKTLSDRAKHQLVHMLLEIVTAKQTQHYASIVGERVFLNLPSFFEAQRPNEYLVASLRYCPLLKEGYPISLEDDKEKFPSGAFAVQFSPQDIAYNLFELIDVRVVVEYAKAEQEKKIEELRANQDCLSLFK